jgi:hypothetical protein
MRQHTACACTLLALDIMFLVACVSVLQQGVSRPAAMGLLMSVFVMTLLLIYLWGAIYYEFVAAHAAQSVPSHAGAPSGSLEHPVL